MVDYTKILDEIISEAKEFQKVFDSMSRDNNPWTKDLNDKLKEWYYKTDRWLLLNYENDPQYQLFKKITPFAIQAKRKNYFSDIVQILEAIKLMPDSPKSNIDDKSDDHSITVNVNQEQSQQQHQVSDLLIEALKDDLTGRQQKELKEIMQSDDKPEQKRSKIIDKLKSFGSDVLSNIVANIITNPAILSSLG